MRPCNQCRTPIENAQLICKECKRRNEEAGVVYDGSPRIQTELGDHEQPKEGDSSYTLLMMTFYFVITALCGLIGLLAFGKEGFYTGICFGLITSLFLFSFMTR